MHLISALSGLKFVWQTEGGKMKKQTVLSMEQALSLPSATLRFAQLGWRVIRLEPVIAGQNNPGDPNRYIGNKVVDNDRHSYFIAPNVGKESIAINLKEREGRELLKKIIINLNVDIFCCNTIPSRYESLGIDYGILKKVKPDIIWAGISGMGPDYPDIPGYDPAIQAMAGFMELTGEVGGVPTLSGIPLTDLKAGDEVFAGVCLALAEKAETGKGKRIDISMFQAATSWLMTVLPLIDFDCDFSEVTRSGNEHKKFVPSNAYKTKDGFIYMAQGSNIQWQRFISLPKYAGLNNKLRETNNGRVKDRVNLHKDIGKIMLNYSSSEILEELGKIQIASSPINTIRQVYEHPAVINKSTSTKTPKGKNIRMQPMAVDMPNSKKDLDFPPKYNQHTLAILKEAKLHSNEINLLRETGIIPE